MTAFLRPFFAATIAAAVMAGTSVPSEAVVRPGPYDGKWSVVIHTLRGDCDRSLRYALFIVNGQVQTQDPGYQATGSVKPSGAIRVMVSQAGRFANGTGKLSGSTGRGSWQTDTGQCSGDWTAERRPAGSLF